MCSLLTMVVDAWIIQRCFIAKEISLQRTGLHAINHRKFLLVWLFNMMGEINSNKHFVLKILILLDNKLILNFKF